QRRTLQAYQFLPTLSSEQGWAYQNIFLSAKKCRGVEPPRGSGLLGWCPNSPGFSRRYYCWTLSGSWDETGNTSAGMETAVTVKENGKRQ
ncbi:hypothetical protein, partial [Pleomorphovibrio marinus]|uniref:hypothetical protein n=1 Tax=Pleomorphovibrio marinus TaxID=2164132 RepID=UPI001E488B4A